MRDKLIRVTVDDQEIDEIDSWLREHDLSHEGRAAALRMMAAIVISKKLKPSKEIVRKKVRQKMEKKA